LVIGLLKAGLYCTHQDISPKYAGILLGITNTAGAIPGVLGVALVGIIFDQTHSWNLALFAPSIFFYLTGIMVWNVFASSEPQTFTS
jgi:ACS family sodium-dependent inorganic phosphate cotransporter